MSLSELQQALRELGIAGMVPMLEVRSIQVQRGQLSFLEALSVLVQDELDRRRTSMLERRRIASGLPAGKDLEGFDWNYNPLIPKQEILELSVLEFIGAGQFVLLVGPPRLGKSHCATALALLALQRGYQVWYRKADSLIADFDAARSRGELGRLWAQLNRAELLVIDDLFRHALPAGAGEYLSLLLMRRRERLATLVSCALPIRDWPQMLGPAAVPMLDRILPRARLVRFEGGPWPLQPPA